MGNTNPLMKVNVYKVKEEYNTFHIISDLKKNKFEYRKNYISNNSVFRLLIKKDKSNESEWVSSISKIFSTKIDQEPGYNIRGIVLITTQENIYISIYGYTKSYIEDYIDSAFGLNFAAKAISNYKINAKNVDYLQKNTLRSSINYKKNSFELPQANEAYYGIVGSPNFNFFGPKITCKEGVAFSKSFKTSNNDYFNLFYEIDKTMKSKDLISIPRLKLLKDSSQLSKKFNVDLLTELKTNSNNISLNIPYLHDIDENITELDSNIVYKISYRIPISSKLLSQQIDLNLSDIQKFINSNSQINDVGQIKIIMYDGGYSSANKIRETKLIRLLLAEKIHNNNFFLLQNGHWGELNSAFVSIMNENLTSIENYKDYNQSKLVQFATYNSNYNIYNSNYYSDTSNRNYAGENGYIETIVRNNCDRVKKLHKRLINGNGLKNEVADFYDTSLKEIFAVKMGLAAGDNVYSFEQSLVSLIILTNKTEFNLNSELDKYNSQNKYFSQQILTNQEINDIENVKNTSILWVVNPNQNRKVSKKILNCTFSIKDISSFIVKLKLIEWFNFCIQCGFNPKLVMISSIDNLSSLPSIPKHPSFKTKSQNCIYYPK